MAKFRVGVKNANTGSCVVHTVEADAHEAFNTGGYNELRFYSAEPNKRVVARFCSWIWVKDASL